MKTESILLLVISVLIILYFMIYSICILNIKKYSKIYLELLLINRKYKPLFHKTQKEYTIYYSCNSLQKFRNNNNGNSITNYLCGYIREQERTWNDVYDKVERNKSKLKEYFSEYERAKSNLAGISYIEAKRKTPITEKWYKKHEERLCSRILLKPITNVSIICIISYRSPKGQSHYSAKWTVGLNVVFERIRGRKEAEQSVAYQRTLMTASKRYDILKRDNYRCKVCGRSADDGAKLEVDHIIPVSKGGKTIDSNLQTLCHECNQGKKAKF